MRNTFLVTYDISNDLRLRRVHKTMLGYGDHLQYSVFECQFTPTDLVRCRHALGTESAIGASSRCRCICWQGIFPGRVLGTPVLKPAEVAETIKPASIDRGCERRGGVE